MFYCFPRQKSRTKKNEKRECRNLHKENRAMVNIQLITYVKNKISESKREYQAQCDAPGQDWSQGSCNSVHGGFKGNADRLHRIIVDDFVNSMDYLLMVGTQTYISRETQQCKSLF